ncbi:MAG: nickel insertion protein [Mycobacterium sp.]
MDHARGLKNGRPGITLSALVSTSSERSVAHATLRHTTTLGVRARRVEHRWALERRFETVTVDGHEISVKFGILDGETVNAKPEHRDCARVRPGHRTQYQGRMGAGAGRGPGPARFSRIRRMSAPGLKPGSEDF